MISHSVIKAWKKSLNNLNSNLISHYNYFQTKEITNFLCNYLHTNKVKTTIIEKNPFKNLYNTNNNLFIHIRLSDVAKFNPGIQYYLNTIKKINFDTIYIATDEPNHDIIHTLQIHYPNLKIVDCNEINTIQFGSTCKHIILSHGSFSALIGYVSFFSTIYYPEYEPNKIWYGDMFSIPGWIKCNYLK